MQEPDDCKSDILDKYIDIKGIINDCNTEALKALLERRMIDANVYIDSDGNIDQTESSSSTPIITYIIRQKKHSEMVSLLLSCHGELIQMKKIIKEIPPFIMLVVRTITI